uniref:Odorant receptor n=1 Tax=Apriona germarii TaxID=157307 RepID=A0A7H9SQS4_APRGE|nr:odorant receptor 10 [Apriona germarii]
MGLAGYYPLAKDKHITLQRISATFFTFIALSYLILGIIFCIKNLSNLGLLSEACAFLLTEVTLIVKMFNFFYYKRNFLLMEEMLRSPLFTEVDAEEENILKENLKTSKIVEILTIIQVLVNISVETLYALFEKKLFLLMWFPFDPAEHFYAVYFFELIACFSGATLAVTIDVLLVYLLDLCAVQCTLLKHRLIKVGATFTGDEAVDDRVRIEKLEKYTIHHDEIYSFAGLVESSFSMGTFVQIVCSSVIICFCLFKTLITPLKSIEFGMLVAYSYDMLWQLVLYCYFGQKVVNASETITEACYMSNWYNCSLKVQKHLLMIMNRANTSVVVTAGGLFPLTLEMLMAILSTAYSFFTLIWKVYNDA